MGRDYRCSAGVVQSRAPFGAGVLKPRRGGKHVADAGVWSIYFTTLLLATLDARDYVIRG